MNKNLLMDEMKRFLDKENIKADEEMRMHTSFKVGGPADVLVTPRDQNDIKEILQICKKNEIPFLIIGNGSNLLVSDKGFRGVVIKILNNFNRYEVNGDIIEAQSGLLLSELSDVAYDYGLTGFEFAGGIPGTLGGAVTMNAGAYGGEMSCVVLKTEYMDKNGNIKTINLPEHQYGYRTSIIKEEEHIVLKSKIKLHRGNREEIKCKMDDFNSRRRDKQPLELPSAGSIFKRPDGYFVGKLVDDSGLRGYTIGGAQISGKHCGFIVNTGNATAKDIISLIDHVRATVKRNYGVDLQTEIRLVGEK